MTIHETRTHLTPAEVIGRARSFFAGAGSPYAAFAEVVGEGYLKLHLEVGEIVIAALPRGDSTLVRGSASRGAHLLSHFLTTLAPPLQTRRTVHRRGLREARAAQLEASAAPALAAPASAGRSPAQAA